MKKICNGLLLVLSLLILHTIQSNTKHIDCNTYTCNNGNTCCDMCIKPYLGVDYLFWLAQSDEPPFAIFLPEGCSSLESGHQQLQNQKFKGASGVRLRGGNFFCDNWYIDVAWTHLKRCSTKAITALHGGVLNGCIKATTLSNLDINNNVSSASSKWCFKFDSIDFDFSRILCPLDTMMIRPYVGIKWAQVKQSQDMNYNTFNIESGFQSRALQDPIVSFTRQNNFSGIGPCVGFYTEWDLVSNISLIAELSGALLYGKFNLNANFFNPSFVPEKPHFIDRKHRLRSMTQMLLGFNWQTQLFCNMNLEIGIAYEAQYWWNQLQVMQSINAMLNSAMPGSGGDFTMHGLTLRFGLGF